MSEEAETSQYFDESAKASASKTAKRKKNQLNGNGGEKRVKKETDEAVDSVKIEANGDKDSKYISVKLESDETLAKDTYLPHKIPFIKPEPVDDSMQVPAPDFLDSLVKDEPSKYLPGEPPIIDIEDLYTSVLPQNPYVEPFDEEKFYEQYPTDEPGPPNWRTIYASVKMMRAKMVAPVDTMGCERLPENIKVEKEEDESVNKATATDGKEELVARQNRMVLARIESVGEQKKEGVSPKVFRFQLFVALLLSSQTKDQVTAAAMENLRNGLNYATEDKRLQTERPGLSVATVLATAESKIDELIYSVGFHRRKASYLKQCAQIFHDKYDDDVPNLPVNALVKELPGFGPKMGHLYVQRAFGVTEGIGVDVHVHRLSKMWGWTRWKPKVGSAEDQEQEPENKKANKALKNPDDPQFSRVRLEAWLPRSLWVDINPALVGFGQTICPSRGAKCGTCLVGARVKCPGYRKK